LLDHQNHYVGNSSMTSFGAKNFEIPITKTCYKFFDNWIMIISQNYFQMCI